MNIYVQLYNAGERESIMNENVLLTLRLIYTSIRNNFQESIWK